MKKKLIEILGVSSLFQKLVSKHYTNFAVSYKIARAAKELDENRTFYMAEEKKLVEKYAKRDENGQIIIEDGNRVRFETPEDGNAFQEEILKLQQTEIDIFDKIIINFKDFKSGDMDLTPMDIVGLEEFVEFVDDNIKEA